MVWKLNLTEYHNFLIHQIVHDQIVPLCKIVVELINKIADNFTMELFS